jgi:hypothetical protein
MGGSFFDGVVSTNCRCPHDVGQYRVAESFLEELNALRTSQHISCLLHQLLEFGYVSVYIVIFKLELSDFCMGSVLLGSIEVLDFKFLKEEVP